MSNVQFPLYIYIMIYIYISNNSQPVSRNNEFRPRPGLLVRTHRPLWTWSVKWWDSSDSCFVWSSPSHLVKKGRFLRKMEGTPHDLFSIVMFFRIFYGNHGPHYRNPPLKGKACCERWISSFWGRHSMKKSTYTQQSLPKKMVRAPNLWCQSSSKELLDDIWQIFESRP